MAPTQRAVASASSAGGLNIATNASGMPSAPTIMKGRRRPMRVIVRSDHAPTQGSQRIDQIFGTKTITVAHAAGSARISVQKYSRMTAGTVENTPVPNEPAA